MKDLDPSKIYIGCEFSQPGHQCAHDLAQDLLGSSGLAFQSSNIEKCWKRNGCGIGHCPVVFQGRDGSRTGWESRLASYTRWNRRG